MTGGCEVLEAWWATHSRLNATSKMSRRFRNRREQQARRASPYDGSDVGAGHVRPNTYKIAGPALLGRILIALSTINFT
jgi:hypothetical protein